MVLCVQNVIGSDLQVPEVEVVAHRSVLGDWSRTVVASGTGETVDGADVPRWEKRIRSTR